MSWKLASVVLVATVMAQGALAADLAQRTFTKAPAPALPASDWSGAYAGVNFGYGAGSNPINMTFTPASDGGEHPVLAPAGWLGGGQLGYNFQVGGWVFGVEGDIQANGLKQSICFDFCDPSLTFRVTQELPWFATARGRLGYAAGPALFYATGGAAFTNVKTSLASIFAPTPSVTGAFQDARTGWVAGGGIEAALGGHWTAKVEYLYMDFGTVTHAIYDPSLGPSSPEIFPISVREHVFRIGLNYLFGDSGRGSALASFADAHAMISPSAYSWSGVYVGGNLGGGVASGPTALGYDNVVSNQSNFAARSFNGGLQAGVNWQVQRLVLGLEGDFQLNDQSQRECYDYCLPDQTVNFATRLPWFATERARIGYATGPLLVYGTAGAAQGRVDTSFMGFDSGFTWASGDFSDVKSGWTAGGGIEAAISDRWSAKAEYLYVDLGNVSHAIPVVYYGSYNATFDTTIHDHIFRVGLNYKVAPF